MKKFKFTIRGNEYDVHIKNVEDNVAQIEVNGTQFDVEVHRDIIKQKTPTLVRKVIKEEAKAVEKKEGGTSYKLKAPLPGIIKEILVKKGDIIKKDQPLVVMEAMKMENNVLAEKDGVVEAIRVTPGDSVLQGEVILETI